MRPLLGSIRIVIGLYIVWSGPAQARQSGDPRKLSTKPNLEHRRLYPKLFTSYARTIAAQFRMLQAKSNVNNLRRIWLPIFFDIKDFTFLCGEGRQYFHFSVWGGATVFKSR